MGNNVVEKVRAAGVVGAGGAGFPTHVKYSSSCRLVIANGAECEPLLSCDQSLMAAYPEKVLRGLELAMEAVGAEEGIIALKGKYTGAISALRGALKGSEKQIRIHELDDFYPAGDELILVYETTGRIVPEGGLPLHVGAVVSNVGTLGHVADAAEGAPVTSRYVTVTGDVRDPATLRLPIGTPFPKAIELAGGTGLESYAVIEGGPMMGPLVDAEEGVVKKTTNGIIVLPGDHPLVRIKSTDMSSLLRRAKSNCEQCRFCTDFCPRHLLGYNLWPHKIMRTVGWNAPARDEIITGVYLCCECGLCGTLYACPTGLSPDRYNAMLRRELAAAGVENPHRRSEIEVPEEREWRKVPASRLIRRLGLEPYEPKAPLREIEPEISRVKIPLSQHIGAPAYPVVKAGEYVRAGDLIGEIPEGKLGARVHASIDGKIEEVSESYILISR